MKVKLNWDIAINIAINIAGDENAIKFIQKHGIFVVDTMKRDIPELVVDKEKFALFLLEYPETVLKIIENE